MVMIMKQRFVGREQELASLNRLYARGSFQMTVIYGRRRVGKTALVNEFVRDKPHLFFTAQQRSEKLNLQTLSRDIYHTFGLPENTPAFSTWTDALDFVAEKASDGRQMVFVFDEFPYAAQASPTLPSTLQIAIDHALQATSIFLILCGSNQGFMESEVLGAKSPLYGRRTMQLKLMPLNYLDAAEMLPTDDPIRRIEYYAAFGGTPYYLQQIDATASLGENVSRLFFDISGLLYAEPQMLLRQELRQPALYESVLNAIGQGATVPKRIAEKSGLEEKSIGRYLATLLDLGIIERVTPFNETSPKARRSIYRLADPFFAFWYRFVSGRTDLIEAGLGDVAAQSARGADFSTYVGRQFEGICLQWLILQARKGATPFAPLELGTWWGADPSAREQVDIDVVLANSQNKQLLAGECKWREAFDETAAIKTLEHRATIPGRYDETFLYLFSKHPVSEGTLQKAAASHGHLHAVSAAELYD